MKRKTVHNPECARWLVAYYQLGECYVETHLCDHKLSTLLDRVEKDLDGFPNLVAKDTMSGEIIVTGDMRDHGFGKKEILARLLML